jgi:Tol biopolymer transport system component
MSLRKIEVPGGWSLPQATDGRLIIYGDPERNEVVYSDLVRKTRGVIIKGDKLWGWMPSRDLSMVALHLRENTDNPGFLALVQTDGKGYRKLGADFAVSAFPRFLINWSWDNRYLLIGEGLRRDQTRDVTMVSTTSGERKQLLALKTGVVDNCVFSPDARFIACKFGVEFGSSGPIRIMMLPVAGGDSRVIWEQTDPNLWLLDWTADGRFLAICSAQMGKSAIRLLPIQDGRAEGEPVTVQPGVYRFGSTTRSGRLILHADKRGGDWSVHLASLGQDGRPGPWRRMELPGENTNNPWPRWSPDSNQFVYTAQDSQGESGNVVVRVRNMATGTDREIFRAPGQAPCVWGRVQSKIFCTQWTDSTTVVSISPESGRVERLGQFPMSYVLPQVTSADGRYLYVGRPQGNNWAVTRWEIGSGRETILWEESQQEFKNELVSPDGRWFVRQTLSEIQVRAASGGEWKRLASTHTNFLTISPDSKWVFYHGDPDPEAGLYRVPTLGGAVERIGLLPTLAHDGSIAISPDGRRILAASIGGSPNFELWALDNFVPAASQR